MSLNNRLEKLERKIIPDPPVIDVWITDEENGVYMRDGKTYPHTEYAKIMSERHGRVINVHPVMSEE